MYAHLSINPPPAISRTSITKWPGGVSYTLYVYVSASVDLQDVAYEWYKGAIGDTSQLIGTGSYKNVYPDAIPASYWVRVKLMSTGCYTDRAVTITN
jgi:hypothetical protein